MTEAPAAVPVIDRRYRIAAYAALFFLVPVSLALRDEDVRTGIAVVGMFVGSYLLGAVIAESRVKGFVPLLALVGITMPIALLAVGLVPYFFTAMIGLSPLPLLVADAYRGTAR